MKLVAFSLLVAGCGAFAPSASVHSSKTSLNMFGPKAAPTNQEFANELGVQVPLGLFDPAGVLDGADKAEFDRIRWVELKHGRIAMLAVVGE